MADQEEGVPTPNPPPNQQQQQDQAGKQQKVVHLNWSNFKPEFSGKPEEDAEVHLLHSNDWVNAHHFVEVLYNILLLTNCYISNSIIKHHSGTCE